MTFKVAGPVSALTIIGVIGAIIVFTIVRKFSKNPNSTFTLIAVAVLLVSFLPDVFVHHLGPMFSEITLDGSILLMTLHTACALITVLALTRLTKPASVPASGAMDRGTN
jgi:Co/Zn/Cd efflux system component